MLHQPGVPQDYWELWVLDKMELYGLLRLVIDTEAQGASEVKDSAVTQQ
uniref:Uncharacterized protein n=1 Tax=Anguilla anguilla TaxID=7936 RepID=A0A0E9XA29_ANGAN